MINDGTLAFPGTLGEQLAGSPRALLVLVLSSAAMFITHLFDSFLGLKPGHSMFRQV